MSSDLLLLPLEALKFYGLRFQIEFSFRVLKHLIGGFGYRFWSCLCRRENSKEKQALIVVNKDHEKEVSEKVLLKLTVIERHVNLAIIAHGILSYLAIAHTKWVWSVHEASSWLRSYSSAIPSDEIVQRALQSQFLTIFSLAMVKDWINSNHVLKLPKKRSKVREHHTLEYFLSS